MPKSPYVFTTNRQRARLSLCGEPGLPTSQFQGHHRGPDGYTAIRMDLPKFQHIRLRLRSEIRSKKTMTIKEVIEECNNLTSVKADSVAVQSQHTASVKVNLVKKGKNSKKKDHPRDDSDSQATQHTQKDAQSRYPCRFCGGMHFYDCPSKNHTCTKCRQTGHADGYCLSASQPGSCFHMKT